jgi:flagellar biosynthesis/type III secretory pathway chaperone
MTSTSTDTERLSELMGHKHALLVQLRDLGKRQLESIDAGDVGQLLKVLSAKQRLLTALNEVERALDPFRNQNPEARRWRTAEDRQQCAQLVVRCEALLNEVMQQEKVSEGQLKLRRDEAHHRLQGAHAAAEARGAYAVNPAHDAGQIDLSSGS